MAKPRRVSVPVLHDPLDSYEPIINWLVKCGRGDLFVRQLAQRCMDHIGTEASKSGNMKDVRKLADYANGWERFIFDERSNP